MITDVSSTTKPSKIRCGLETAIALFAAAFGVLTIFWDDWIESLTGWDPDQHNGSSEWAIVAVLFAVAAVLGVAARRDWRLRSAATEAPSGLR